MASWGCIGGPFSVKGLFSSICFGMFLGINNLSIAIMRRNKRKSKGTSFVDHSKKRKKRKKDSRKPTPNPRTTNKSGNCFSILTWFCFLETPDTSSLLTPKPIPKKRVSSEISPRAHTGDTFF